MSKFYAVNNDIIGGWDVSEYNKPLSEHDPKCDERTLGSFMTNEDAIRVAQGLNMLASFGDDDVYVIDETSNDWDALGVIDTDGEHIGNLVRVWSSEDA